MEDLNTKFQIFLSVKSVRLILKNFLLEMTIYCKRSNHQKNQEKTEIKIRKKGLRKIHKTYTIWIEFSSSPIKLILPPHRSRMHK